MTITDTKMTDPVEPSPSLDVVVIPDAEQLKRPSTAPAYYLARPAEVWMAVFRRSRSKA
jgi:hypothetical protein